MVQRIPSQLCSVAANYMLLMCTKAAGVTEDEVDFEVPVDGEATGVVNISPFLLISF